MERAFLEASCGPRTGSQRYVHRPSGREGKERVSQQSPKTNENESEPAEISGADLESGILLPHSAHLIIGTRLQLEFIDA